MIARWSDETATAIEAASPADRDAERQRLAMVWVNRLKDLLEEHPELQAALRAWADQIRQDLPAVQQTWVQHFVASDHANQYNAPHGAITVHHHGAMRPEGQ
ncbi:hypothetical protein [Phytohabitans aurantiacus]|uniref:hypothetical protein n=1 Tax=Phytohabitans aurantiacus TaxID=3016789 RepID=UPI00248FDE8D|nr:hypothetical protein [Phytohabitans aurantiacus]